MSESGPRAGSWQVWLGALAEAAIELERRLDAGEPALFDAPLPPAPADAGPLPSGLADVALRLLDELMAVQSRAQAERDVLAGRLAGTAVPRPRSRFDAYDLGGALDVEG